MNKTADKINHLKAIERLFAFDGLNDDDRKHHLDDGARKHKGWLLNVVGGEVLKPADDDDSPTSNTVVNMYFYAPDPLSPANIKLAIPFCNYFYVILKEGHECGATENESMFEVTSRLAKKFGEVFTYDLVEKVDLTLPNHICAKSTRLCLKLSFKSAFEMSRVRYFLLKIVNDSNGDKLTEEEFEIKNFIADVKEHDLDIVSRFCIDLDIFVARYYYIFVYNNNNNDQFVLPPKYKLLHKHKNGSYTFLLTNKQKIAPFPADLRVFAFDIETVKQPLKFPNAEADEIMMISFVTEVSQAFLLINRNIVSEDIGHFEFVQSIGSYDVTVFNEPTEKDMLIKFFELVHNFKPHVFVTYNGDFFDLEYINTRCAHNKLSMDRHLGLAMNKSLNGGYISPCCVHIDCLYWVKRDSYLPVGSHGLKSVSKLKLNYDPIELDPELMVPYARNSPQKLADYSVSDSIATYLLYIKYIHPFVFSLSSIIPIPPDGILRKGSGTLCEALLMSRAYQLNLLFPNKSVFGDDFTFVEGDDNRIVESETYVGGRVETLNVGLYKADIQYGFDIDRSYFYKNIVGKLKKIVKNYLQLSLEVGVELIDEKSIDSVVCEITEQYTKLYGELSGDVPNLNVKDFPSIIHLDVSAMYPNIILTNRLQPHAIINEYSHDICGKCDLVNDKLCKREMNWIWRANFLPMTKTEFRNVVSKNAEPNLLKKKVTNYCRKVYKKSYVIEEKMRKAVVCQRENPFYVDTVKFFRDKRYHYKELAKSERNSADDKLFILYESLQLAHKCILNSFYGYVMRKGSRWFSMEMAGVVCHTGTKIITETKNIIQKVGIPIELDTDGIWCAIPQNYFIDKVEVLLKNQKKVTFSLINAVLNNMLHENFTNSQYFFQDNITQKNTIMFEIDGPYYAILLPAAKEQNKNLKKRYAVFDYNKKMIELKGFELKRRGELQIIKNFQSEVFYSFLNGNTLNECYASASLVAEKWLSFICHNESIEDEKILELLSEKRVLNKAIAEYGAQKSTALTTARRLAEILGDQILTQNGSLTCEFVVASRPAGQMITERAIPTVVFQCEKSVQETFLNKWLKDGVIQFDSGTGGKSLLKSVLDYDYYLERLVSAIQKIIIIPGMLQGLERSPVENKRCPAPEWLLKKCSLNEVSINSFFLKRIQKEKEVGVEKGGVSEKENERQDEVVENNVIGMKKYWNEMVKRRRLFERDQKIMGLKSLNVGEGKTSFVGANSSTCPVLQYKREYEDGVEFLTLLLYRNKKIVSEKIVSKKVVSCSFSLKERDFSVSGDILSRSKVNSIEKPDIDMYLVFVHQASSNVGFVSCCSIFEKNKVEANFIVGKNANINDDLKRYFQNEYITVGSFEKAYKTLFKKTVKKNSIIFTNKKMAHTNNFNNIIILINKTEQITSIDWVSKSTNCCNNLKQNIEQIVEENFKTSFIYDCPIGNLNEFTLTTLFESSYKNLVEVASNSVDFINYERRDVFFSNPNYYNGLITRFEMENLVVSSILNCESLMNDHFVVSDFFEMKKMLYDLTRSNDDFAIAQIKLFYRWFVEEFSCVNKSAKQFVRHLIILLLNKIYKTIEKMGCQVVYLDINEVWIASNKTTYSSACDQINNIVKRINEISHLNLYGENEKKYKNILFADISNYAGIFQEDDQIDICFSDISHFFEDIVDETNMLPKLTEAYFAAVGMYLLRRCKTNKIDEHFKVELYDMTNYLNQNFASAEIQKSAAFYFVILVSKTICLDAINKEVGDKIKNELLKILNLSEFKVERENLDNFGFVSKKKNIKGVFCGNCLKEQTVLTFEGLLYYNNVECRYCGSAIEPANIEKVLLIRAAKILQKYNEQMLQCEGCKRILPRYNFKVCECGSKSFDGASISKNFFQAEKQKLTKFSVNHEMKTLQEFVNFHY